MQSKNGNFIVAFIIIFIILGAAAYIYGTTKNPKYAEFWANFWKKDFSFGMGFSEQDKSPCYGQLDCSKNKICVSTRVCLQGALNKECDCFGSTEGSCKDYIATGVQVKNCAGEGQKCGNEPGTNIIHTLCCPGLSCNNGICEGQDGRC